MEGWPPVQSDSEEDEEEAKPSCYICKLTPKSSWKLSYPILKGVRNPKLNFTLSWKDSCGRIFPFALQSWRLSGRAPTSNARVGGNQSPGR